MNRDDDWESLTLTTDTTVGTYNVSTKLIVSRIRIRLIVSIYVS